MAFPEEKYKKELLDMPDELHPHMKGDNYTRRLLMKVFNNDKLTAKDNFDLGKYYSRMLPLAGMEMDRLHSLTWIKMQIYSR